MPITKVYLPIYFILLSLLPLQAKSPVVPSTHADAATAHLQTLLADILGKYQSAVSRLPNCDIETDVFVQLPESNQWNLGIHEKYVFSGRKWRYEAANVANEPISGTFAFDGTTEMQKVCGMSLIQISKGQTDVHATMSTINSFFKPFSFLLAPQNLKEGGIYSLTTGSNFVKLWTQFINTSKSLSIVSDAAGNYELTRSTYIDGKFVSTDKITFDAKNSFYPTQYLALDPNGKLIIKYSVLKWSPFPNMPTNTTLAYPSEAREEQFNPDGTPISSMLFKIARINVQAPSPTEFVLDLKSVVDVQEMESGTVFHSQPEQK